jgi:acyl-CoA synthetase (AMP-forming)/AMP-acid ligase II
MRRPWPSWPPPFAFLKRPSVDKVLGATHTGESAPSPDAGAPLAPTLEAACRRWAERPAVTYRGHTITYTELWRQVSALAGAYRRLGIRPGDRVISGLRNCPEHVVAIAAAWAVGAIHVGADDDLTGPELSDLVEHTEAAAVLFHPRPGADDPQAALRAVAGARPETLRIVHEGEPGAGEHVLADLLEGGEAGAPIEPLQGPDEPGLMFLTSGTTGRPKGVLETLPACWAKMQFFTDAFRPGPNDVHLVYLPIAHVFGLRLALIALLRGGRLVLQERFSPAGALRLVTDEGVTVLPGMPPHLTLLLRALDPDTHDLSHVRWVVSAAATLPRPLAEQVYERLGAEILYVFGCSEGFTTQTTDRDEILRGSVGRTVFRGPPGTPADGTVAILDPQTHTPVAPGEVGEICFGASVPVRYWRHPDVATDGWYRSGDLGRIDEDGLLYVLGRRKEVVNRGGLKVSPTEVEAVLVRHAGVADAAVVATPDPVLGEAVCACVVAANGDAPDLAAVREFLGATLARHKLPDELCVLDRIPRSPLGKVDRPVLRSLVVDGDAARQRLRPR